MKSDMKSGVWKSLAVAAGLALASGLAVAQEEGLKNPIRGGIPKAPVGVSLELVAEGLTAPTGGIHAPGDASRLFVTDQDGTLWAIDLATGAKSVFLDTSGLLVPLGARPGDPFNLDFDERGLIGLAFHPDYAMNGKLYTYTSEPLAGAADFTTTPGGPTEPGLPGLTVPNHQSVIREWMVPIPADPASVVDPASTRVLLRIDEPQFNHNSGALAFDNSGKLLIAVGDGGGADDQPAKDLEDFIGVPILGHGAAGNGQNPGTILGSILRIDVDARTSPNGEYGVPADNPFVTGSQDAVLGGQAGCQDGVCDEIYAYGFRNPFRLSVDRKTGLVFVGDVGQNNIEEVDIIIGMGNYGWNVKEGTFFFDDDGNEPGFVTKRSRGQPETMVDPIAEYDHDEGTAIVGGFIHRAGGKLEGHYLFGDFSRPPFNPFGVVCDGRLFMLNTDFDEIAGQVAEMVDDNELLSRIREFKRSPLAGECLLGFGQDLDGNVYALTNETGIPQGATGKVLRIVPAR